MCTANIARSPLAEVLLAAHADAAGAGEVVVRSAGVRAQAGYPAAEHSITIARRWGLDLSHHRSQPVTDELLAGSDLIVTMSARQRDLLGPRLPGLAQRLFTLGELRRLTAELDPAALPTAPQERLQAVARRAQARRPVSAPADGEDVADPIGQPLATYVEMANHLLRLTEPLAPLLFRRSS